MIPFLKRVHPDLVVHSLLKSPHLWPLAFVPFLIFVSVVIAGASNAVNLTDGLDGLAIGCTVIAAGALTVLTYVSSNYRWATYLDIQYRSEEHTSELQSLTNLVCRLLLEKKKTKIILSTHAEIL